MVEHEAQKVTNHVLREGGGCRGKFLHCQECSNCTRSCNHDVPE